MKASSLIRFRLLFLTVVTLTIVASQFSVGVDGYLESYRRMRTVLRHRETVRLEKERRLKEIINKVMNTNYDSMPVNVTVLSNLDQQHHDQIGYELNTMSFGMQYKKEQHEEEKEDDGTIFSQRPSTVNEVQQNRTMSAFDNFKKIFG